jgi:hypothetical protein
MKLDRNIDGGHGNKYGLIKNRQLEQLRDKNGYFPERVAEALLTLVEAGVLDWGCTPETEFFVIRLKDKYAAGGLFGYANEADADDHEYAKQVAEMALRAGSNHPNCKAPD